MARALSRPCGIVPSTYLRLFVLSSRHDLSHKNTCCRRHSLVLVAKGRVDEGILEAEYQAVCKGSLADHAPCTQCERFEIP